MDPTGLASDDNDGLGHNSGGRNGQSWQQQKFKKNGLGQNSQQLRLQTIKEELRIEEKSSVLIKNTIIKTTTTPGNAPPPGPEIGYLEWTRWSWDFAGGRNGQRWQQQTASAKILNGFGYNQQKKRT
jgi:hypothetical protein